MNAEPLPRWRATVDTVGFFNNLWAAGSIVRAMTKPGPDWVRIDESGEVISVRSAAAAAPDERPIFGAGFKKVGSGYTAKYVAAKPDSIFEQRTAVPRYRYSGKKPAVMIFGDLRRRGETFSHLGWPDDPLAEPANEPAREVAAYFAQHKGHPRLPFTAWDVEQQTVRTIGPKGYTPPAPTHPTIPPRVYSRDPEHPKYRRQRAGDDCEA